MPKKLNKIIIVVINLFSQQLLKQSQSASRSFIYLFIFQKGPNTAWAVVAWDKIQHDVVTLNQVRTQMQDSTLGGKSSPFNQKKSRYTKIRNNQTFTTFSYYSDVMSLRELLINISPSESHAHTPAWGLCAARDKTYLIPLPSEMEAVQMWKRRW